MKKVEISIGGHYLKADDIRQLQASVTDLVKGYNSRYVLPNTPIKGVILSGMVLVANGAFFDCSAGWIAVAEQVYYVIPSGGLDFSGGKKMFVEVQLIQGISRPLFMGGVEYPYPDYQMSVYTALAKNNTNDYEVGSGADIVPYGDWIAAAINFDSSAYLLSQNPAWQLVVSGNTTSTGWVIQYPFKYRIDQVGTVHLTGVLRSLPSPNFTPVIEFLPVGARPTQREMRFLCPSSANYTNNWRGNRTVELVIGTDGRVAIENANLDVSSYIFVEIHLSFSAI
jgi:hypothetical protein